MNLLHSFPELWKAVAWF